MQVNWSKAKSQLELSLAQFSPSLYGFILLWLITKIHGFPWKKSNVVYNWTKLNKNKIFLSSEGDNKKNDQKTPCILNDQHPKIWSLYRYLTRLQMLQFVCVFLHALQPLYYDCDYPRIIPKVSSSLLSWNNPLYISAYNGEYCHFLHTLCQLLFLCICSQQ